MRSIDIEFKAEYIGDKTIVYSNMHLYLMLRYLWCTIGCKTLTVTGIMKISYKKGTSA